MGYSGHKYNMWTSLIYVYKMRVLVHVDIKKSCKYIKVNTLKDRPIRLEYSGLKGQKVSHPSEPKSCIQMWKLKPNVNTKSQRKSIIYPAIFPSESELTLLGSRCLGITIAGVSLMAIISKFKENSTLYCIFTFCFALVWWFLEKIAFYVHWLETKRFKSAH